MVLRVLAVLVCLAGMLGTVESASAQKLVVTINKSTQKMTVQVDGDREFVWPVSTGAAGYDTPSGTYRPFRMEVDHFSQEWDDAPMPHSIFFTPEGHAIHGSFHTKRLGTRASHGCVRLAPENAAVLYAMVEKAGLRQTTVVIKGGGLFDWDSSDSVEGPAIPPTWFEKVQARPAQAQTRQMKVQARPAKVQTGQAKMSSRSKGIFPLFHRND